MQSAAVIPISLYNELIYIKYTLNHMLYRIVLLLWSMKSVTSPTVVPLIIAYTMI